MHTPSEPTLAAEAGLDVTRLPASRRSLIRTALWATPAVSIVGAAPAFAASQPSGPSATDTPSPTNPPVPAPEALRRAFPEIVHLKDGAGYDAGRASWNLSADQKPGAVALPRTADEARRVIAKAIELGLLIAPQSTGHAAPVLARHDLSNAVLVRTGALNAVEVNTAARTVKIGAGAQWQDVIAKASPHGLAALHGSAPTVGVVGYSLGGGLGWYARKHGFAANSITALDIVDAQGAARTITASSAPDLFWAMRGGAGNFGVVTGMEMRLFEIADVYAGMMIWDVQHARDVMKAYAAWSTTAPDEVTASLRVMRFPPLDAIPAFLRGRTVMVLDAVVLEDDATAAGIMAPFVALTPEINTFARVPASSLTGLHMDPSDPSPSRGDNVVLSSLDDAAIDALLALVGHTPMTSLMVAELRLLGGALSRPAAGGGALDHVAGTHLAVVLSPTMNTQGAAAVEADASRVIAALQPWSTGRSLLNFADRAKPEAPALPAATLTRLRSIKAAEDPKGVFLANLALS